ncbi:MAG: ribonuclease J [Desulfovibrionaceae bacterium]|nr:ribonuclease J [Desulfovibrionaceae bacterium]
MENSYLKITPLGGLGEIGLNCQLWETEHGVVMIDCGIMFPSDELLGVDLLIPHFGAVNEVRDRVCCIILTHGHEDHIGALPWLVPLLKGVRIYGSDFTLALVEHKLLEHNVLDYVELVRCDWQTVIEAAGMRFHFFPVCHSIPQGFALGVETEVGKIIHSGDFKIDPAPLSGPGTDLAALKAFAGDNLRLLFSDSTNVGRLGHSLTEREVRDSLANIFAKARGRIIITLFSSHIQRIQEVFDLATKFGRTVVITGKSLATNIDIAKSLDLVDPPNDFYNAHYELPNLPDDQVVIVATGAQGEPFSALARMTYGAHKDLEIHEGDTVLMSSRIIPGNTTAIIRLINAMYHKGAEVLYEGIHSIHASGHAHREELRALIETLKPELFVPVHGEFQHLVKHLQLARECGVAPDNCIFLEDGLPLVLYPTGYELDDPVPVECTLVDGKGVGDVGNQVLRERRLLGAEGLVIVVLVFDAESGIVLKGPEILSKGFTFTTHNYLLEDAKCLVLDEIENLDSIDEQVLTEQIRLSLRRFFRNVLGREPVIVSVISFV